MPTIKLQEGDFGADVSVTADLTSIYLPDPKRPGGIAPVPLASVADMEAIADDHSGRLKDAAALSLKGIAVAGPVGLAAGLLAARKVKDVVFNVRLDDGRKFVAVADAATYADLHAAQIEARAEATHPAGDADSVIEKYLLGLADNVHTATFEPARAAPEPSAPLPASPTERAPERAPMRRPERPVFGKRGRAPS